jgi:hypothetical protein
MTFEQSRQQDQIRENITAGYATQLRIKLLKGAFHQRLPSAHHMPAFGKNITDV